MFLGNFAAIGCRCRKLQPLTGSGLFVLVTFLHFGIRICQSNSLWEDLYFGCDDNVSFHCVQTKLTDYVNDTLNSDRLSITDGIYFVKRSELPSTPAIYLYEFTTDRAPNETIGRSRLPYRRRSGRDLPLSENEIDTDGYSENETSNLSVKHVEKAAKEEEEGFASFVRTVENIERTLDRQGVDNGTTQKSSESGAAAVTAGTTVAGGPVSTENSTQADVSAVKNDGRSSSDKFPVNSLYRITDLLYDKASRYFITHDLHLYLPQFLFGDGTRLRISPKGFDEDGGVLVKFNVLSTEVARNGNGNGGSGNFVSKYFHKVFKKKLLTSFLALLLIIKLIKIKIMYVLPFLIGVNHAKKLLLKTLLFLFPPLVHLFKLCTFYHAHASKLHFHHHKVKHHHHHIKVPVPVPIPVPVHKPSHYGTHEEEDYPPSPSLLNDYPSIDSSYGPDDHPTHDSFGSYSNTAAAAPTDEYYNKNDVGKLQQHGDEFASWGLKDFYASTESPGVLSAQAQAFSPYAEQNYKYPATAVGASNNVYNTRISAYPSAPGMPSYKDPTFNQNVKKVKNGNVWKSKQPPTALAQTAALKGNPTVLTAYDPFYSPILQKIDALFTQLGFNDEGCRERLICSMYKNPIRFSPHSNLLSTELSRDPNELERPIHTNVAVIRFYRYVDAARNGQSQKDCIKLYSSCSVKTER